MSTSSHSPADGTDTRTLRATDRYECECCETDYRLIDGVSRRFCSDVCQFKTHASDLLNTIRFDHRYCTNCFRKLREVEPPGRRLGSSDLNKPVPECAIGTAGYLPETTIGLAEVYDRADPVNGEWHFEPVSFVGPSDPTNETRICECGACNHQSVYRRELTKAQLKTLAERLSAAVSDLHDEQKHDFEHSRNLLLHAALSAKENPDKQFRDRSILRNALATSLILSHRR